MESGELYGQNEYSLNTNVLENCLKIEVPYELYQHLKTNGKLEKLCRTCLSPVEEASVSLFAAVEDGSQLCLLDMLKAFTSIQEFSGNGLPTQICAKCHIELIECYNYKIKCETSECTLKSLLRGQFIPDTPEHIAEVREVLNKCEEVKLKCNEDNEYDFKEDMKEEFDVQYLDDFDDGESDSEALHIVLEKVKEAEFKIDERTTGSKSSQKGVLTRSKKQKHVKNVQILISKNSCKKTKIGKNTKVSAVNQQNPERASYPCAECKEVFSSEHDQQVHLAVHTMVGSMWKCTKCPKEFKKRSLLRRHVQRHMELKRFKCSVCEKTFAEFYSLRRHSRVHTGEMVEKKHVCNICGKRYEGSHQLSAHLSQHSSARPFVCAACGKAFATSRLLNSHRLVHSDLKPYACQYCDKRFRHDSTRNTHHRTHTGEKPYVCSTCGKTFIQNSNLRLHMRTHTGERPYACDKCDKKFTSGSTLKMHIRTHTGERPYSCKICGKRFARKDLSVHMRNHSGEKPYACSVCPKKFVNVSRLRDHCRLHTGEKPFECATCTQTFSSKSYLIKHFKKHQTKKKQEKEKQKQTQKKQYLVVQHLEPLLSMEYPYAILNEKGAKPVSDSNITLDDPVDEVKTINELQIEEEHNMPLEVTGELVVQEEGDVLVVDNSQNQNTNLYLSTETVNQCDEFGNNVNLVTVSEGEVNIINAKSLLDESTVKLYQIHQTNTNSNT